MIRATALVAVATLLLSCGAIVQPAASSIPVNGCQLATDCSAYGPQAQCIAGICQVIKAPPGNAIAVITFPQNAPNGAGQAYAMPLSSLFNVPATGDCQPGSCATLAPIANAGVSLVGLLECTNLSAQQANYDLGGGPGEILPVRAVFTPQWPMGKGVYVDATAVGLPLLPVVGNTQPDPTAANVPGPAGTQPMQFSLINGLPTLSPMVYERALTPLAPFDSHFPPDLQIVDTGAAKLPSENVLWDGNFDTTSAGANPIPTFQFSRADQGTIDGWTAYLRDASTLRAVSPMVSLAGVYEHDVKLLTSRHADALSGVELVMDPPAGGVLPRWIFTPVNDSLVGGTYPKLPSPVTASISIEDKAHGLEAADVIFQAIDVCYYPLKSTTAVPDPNHDFEFNRRFSTASGKLEVELPRGSYRVTVIPRSEQYAVTVVSQFRLADSSCNPLVPVPIQLAPPSVVSGSAVVADGRPLADATVELVPTACADSTVDPSCLPRGAQTTTASDGTYVVSVDPGSYWLRVRPARGSRLPWVVQSLSTTAPAPRVIVPAPIDVGLQLRDVQQNLAAGALVQVFVMPSSGVAYEIGETVADSAGHFDVYLDPSAQ